LAMNKCLWVDDFKKIVHDDEVLINTFLMNG